MAFMEKIFIHVTEFQNLTNVRRVEFRVVDDLCRIRDLSPGKTRQVKVDPIIRCCERNQYMWNIGVWLEGKFTGVEISPLVVIDYARLIFRLEINENGTNVLVVEGIREKKSDYLLRLKFFGFMRNIYWDKRPCVVIARSDSKLATKLRNLNNGDRMIEAREDPVKNMDPLPKRLTKSPLTTEGYKHDGEEGKTKTTDQSSSTTSDFTDVPHAPPMFQIITNSMGSFDHVLLFVLAMTLVGLVRVSFG